MSSPQVVALVYQIKSALPQCGSVGEATNMVRGYNEPLLGSPLPDDIEMALLEASQCVENSLKPIEVLQKHSIFEPQDKWYTGPSESDRHWPSLWSYIAHSKDWGEDTANDIGGESDEVVSLLADPNRMDFQYRGLVVGYVQSGKTANMTAVIAKAVDTGYNMVVVLAGLTNKLRKQTQSRMQTDLVNRHPGAWLLWTSEEDGGDFRMPKGKSFIPPSGNNLVQLCVLKKNVSPLKHFIQTLDKTPSAILRDLRVLIIDDECDSASVNAASNELNITAINENIRQIIKKFPAVSYVGYTATPFANVLINPYPDNTELDDLYPRNFITSLQCPANYFGTERLFGKEPSDVNNPTPEEEGLDMIRAIPESNILLLQPGTRAAKDTFYPEMPKSLEDAILYFLAACAARRYRGQLDEHMTMLVHTSVYTILHDRVSALISGWLEINGPDLRGGHGEVFDRMHELWQFESERLPEDITKESRVHFKSLSEQLGTVLDKIDTPVENGFSANRIDYDGDAKTYIVVGGTVLARGLTLEGLMVSYFLRTTSQYDTLLQMGRWFGYRRGYEDFPRIWMTKELEASFRMLATVEEEIRSDISEYSERNVSPMAFAVRIRSIPGMAITAASKRRHASICDVSYSGNHRQTLRFYHDKPDIVSANWQAGADLLSSSERLGLNSGLDDKVLYRGVPVTLVRKFLHTYSLHPDHKELSAEFLIKYIDDVQGGLPMWNVGLYQPGNGVHSGRNLGVVDDVRLTNRAKLSSGTADMADIKALMSKKDVVFDCDDNPPADVQDKWDRLKTWRREQIGDIPMLLLYAINKDSTPARPSKLRAELGACDHLLAFGIVFPGSEQGGGGYVSVSLDPPSGDDLESLDEEIDQRVGAGDVL